MHLMVTAKQRQTSKTLAFDELMVVVAQHIVPCRWGFLVCQMSHHTWDKSLQHLLWYGINCLKWSTDKSLHFCSHHPHTVVRWRINIGLADIAYSKYKSRCNADMCSGNLWRSQIFYSSCFCKRHQLSCIQSLAKGTKRDQRFKSLHTFQRFSFILQTFCRFCQENAWKKHAKTFTPPRI